MKKYNYNLLVDSGCRGTISLPIIIHKGAKITYDKSTYICINRPNDKSDGNLMDYSDYKYDKEKN